MNIWNCSLIFAGLWCGGKQLENLIRGCHSLGRVRAAWYLEAHYSVFLRVFGAGGQLWGTDVTLSLVKICKAMSTSLVKRIPEALGRMLRTCWWVGHLDHRVLIVSETHLLGGFSGVGHSSRAPAWKMVPFSYLGTAGLWAVHGQHALIDLLFAFVLKCTCQAHSQAQWFYKWIKMVLATEELTVGMCWIEKHENRILICCKCCDSGRGFILYKTFL